MDSFGVNYVVNFNISVIMVIGVDFFVVLDVNFIFFVIYDIEGGNFDYCYVEVSSDGINWINIVIFLGEGNFIFWVEYFYFLGGFVGNSDVKVCFCLFIDGGYEVDGIYIDDVVIISFDQDNFVLFVLYEGLDFYESVVGDVVFIVIIIDIFGIVINIFFYSVDGGLVFFIMGVLEGDDVYSYIVFVQEVGV